MIKGLCVIASAALASLVKESLVPHEWVEIASWASGALLALPVQVDRFFGYVSVHRSSLLPGQELGLKPDPLPPPSRVPREYRIPTDEGGDDGER